jgi:hypothetical protein
MKLSDSRIQKEIVNDQTVYIPTEEGWAELLQEPVLEGVEAWSFYVEDMLKYQLDLTRKHSGVLRLCFYIPNTKQELRGWLFCLLLRVFDGWQRVHMERLTCENCGWFGLTANPLVSDLYFGVLDSVASLRQTYKYPVLPCPQCESKLPRYPIWIETVA